MSARFDAQSHWGRAYDDSTSQRPSRRPVADARGGGRRDTAPGSTSSRNAPDYRQQPRMVYDKYQLATMNSAEVGPGPQRPRQAIVVELLFMSLSLVAVVAALFLLDWEYWVVSWLGKALDVSDMASRCFFVATALIVAAGLSGSVVSLFRDLSHSSAAAKSKRRERTEGLYSRLFGSNRRRVNERDDSEFPYDHTPSQTTWASASQSSLKASNGLHQGSNPRRSSSPGSRQLDRSIASSIASSINHNASFKDESFLNTSAVSLANSVDTTVGSLSHSRPYGTPLRGTFSTSFETSFDSVHTRKYAENSGIFNTSMRDRGHDERGHGRSRELAANLNRSRVEYERSRLDAYSKDDARYARLRREMEHAVDQNLTFADFAPEEKQRYLTTVEAHFDHQRSCRVELDTDISDDRLSRKAFTLVKGLKFGTKLSDWTKRTKVWLWRRAIQSKANEIEASDLVLKQVQSILMKRCEDNGREVPLGVNSKNMNEVFRALSYIKSELAQLDPRIIEVLDKRRRLLDSARKLVPEGSSSSVRDYALQRMRELALDQHDYNWNGGGNGSTNFAGGKRTRWDSTLPCDAELVMRACLSVFDEFLAPSSFSTAHFIPYEERARAHKPQRRPEDNWHDAVIVQIKENPPCYMLVTKKERFAGHYKYLDWPVAPGANNVFETVALLAYVVATKLGNSINNKPLDMRNFGFVDIVKEEGERLRAARERF